MTAASPPKASECWRSCRTRKIEDCAARSVLGKARRYRRVQSDIDCSGYVTNRSEIATTGREAGFLETGRGRHETPRVVVSFDALISWKLAGVLE